MKFGERNFGTKHSQDINVPTCLDIPKPLADHVTVIWLRIWSRQQSDCRRVRYSRFSRLHYHHNASNIILLIIMSVTATLISKISQVFCLANEGWELVFFIILCPVAAKLLYSNWGCSQELLISGWTMYVEYFILLDKLCIHTKRMSKLYYKTLDFIKLENL